MNFKVMLKSVELSIFEIERRGMQRFYGPEIEAAMKATYDSFSERDRRRYAGVECQKLPHGGVSYICNILGCHSLRLYRGLYELKGRLPETEAGRIRKRGGGRKKTIDITENIDEIFLKVLKERTAGDPMNADLIWTDLKAAEISKLMKSEGLEISPWIVKQLLKKHGYSYRSAIKSMSVGTSANRNEQFENITRLKAEYQQNGNPIISMDAKKKRRSEISIEPGNLLPKKQLKSTTMILNL
jgi:transposase